MRVALILSVYFLYFAQNFNRLQIYLRAMSFVFCLFFLLLNLFLLNRFPASIDLFESLHQSIVRIELLRFINTGGPTTLPILTEPILAMLVLIRAHSPLHLFFSLIGLRIYNFRLVVNHFLASVVQHVPLPLLHDGRLFSCLGLAFGLI